MTAAQAQAHVHTLIARGLTAAAIARKLGVSDRSVYRWRDRQAGPRGHTADALERLANGEGDLADLQAQLADLRERVEALEGTL